MPPKVAGRKKQNGYKMPEPLPKGESLQDMQKNTWRVGDPLGSGGFGLIYSAQQQTTEKTSKEFPYAVKIEPHSNGPLFVEMQFYMRNAKETDVNTFKDKHKLKSFGMPIFVASGSHIHNEEKYRFLVMKKFGTDLWQLYLDSDKVFPTVTCYKLALQVLNVLEYVHERGYVHADIKGANLLLESKSNPDQVYLVDYGLASHFSKEKVLKVDAKKAHNGTIEYTSRDAHNGVMTRRGDLEILFYNLIHWFGGQLNWEFVLNNVKTVQEYKIKAFEDIREFLTGCFTGDTSLPDGLLQLGKYITELEFNSEIDYKKVEKLFKSLITKNGGTLNSPLVFKTGAKRKSPEQPQSRLKKTKTTTTRQKKKVSEETNEDVEEIEEVVGNSEETKVVKAVNKGVKKTTKSYPENVKKAVNKNNNENLNGLGVVTRSNSVEERKEEVLPAKKRERRVNTTNNNNVEENGENLTAEMLRLQDKITASKSKGKKLMVSVPTTSKANPKQGLKTRKMAEKIPPIKTHILLEQSQDTDEELPLDNVKDQQPVVPLRRNPRRKT